MAVSFNDLLVGPLTLAAGVTTISLDFFFERGEWLEVYKSTSEIPLVYGAEFTVTGEGTSSGTVRLTSAATGAESYSIYLAVPLQRSSDMQARGEFKSNPFNVEMDRLWQRLQYHWTMYNRTLRLSRTSLADGVIRDISGGQYIRLDDDGLGFSGVDPVFSVTDLDIWFGVRNSASAIQAASLTSGTVFVMGGFYYITDPAATGVNSATNDLGVNGIRPFGTQLFIEQFGNGLQAAFDYVKAYNLANGYSLGGAGSTSRAKLSIDIGSRRLTLSAKVLVDDPQAFILTGRNAIIEADFPDYLLEFTGLVSQVEIRGIVFECTSVGGVKFDADNVSSHRVVFDECRFTTDEDGADTAIAVEYTNRSSTLLFRSCYFNRVKHPLHNKICDYVTFDDNCWFGFPAFSEYADYDGYIRMDTGFLKIGRCLFAGGPSWYPGKTRRDGSAMPQYFGVAYVKVGLRGALGSPVDHARVLIDGARIGYEVGAGYLVSYYVQNVGFGGAEFRSGIELRSIQTAPRNDTNNNLAGLAVGTLFLLNEMPHQIIVDGVHCNQGNLGIIAPGPDTTLAALRAQVDKPVDHQTRIAGQQAPRSHNTYSIKDMTAVNSFMTVGATTSEEDRRWLELFGLYDYFFPSNFPDDNAGGNSTTVRISTWFTDFSLGRRSAVFEVFGGAYGSVASGDQTDVPIYGHIVVGRDETGTDTLFAKYQSAVDVSDLSPGITITAKLLSGGVAAASRPTSGAADCRLVIDLTHATSPGVSEVRCGGLIVRPKVAELKRYGGQAIAQYY